MIRAKVLSIAAMMALVLPMAAPTASFAQRPGVGRAAGAGVRVGGGGGPRFSGGAPAMRFRGASGGGGGGFRRGGGGGGFIPGAIAGAVIGGAIATAPYGYYGGPGYYYAPGYSDDEYYDSGPVVVAPAPGGDDAVAYCMQTYRSYDPQSGTYLGFDGLRHPCP